MIKNRKWLSALCGGAFAVGVVAPAIAISGLNLPSSINATTDEIAVDNPVEAARTFVKAMANGDETAVWMFATEEEHDAFGTELEAYEAYAEAYPVLVRAAEVIPGKQWREGETPFVEARIVDQNGDLYRGTFGFWLSDAGDWQLISCDVVPYSDRVAGL